MKLSLSSPPTPDTCKYPNTLFSFILKFLLWNRNPVTKVCSSCPFYVYSHVFVALNMIVNFIINSYHLVKALLRSGPDAAEKAEPTPDNDWVVPVRLWRFQITIRITSHYLQLLRALFNVQTMARGLYYLLVVEDYGPLLGGVITVPLLLMLNAASAIVNYRKNCDAPTEEANRQCRVFLLKESFDFVVSLLFWSNLCCLLYNRYVNCAFE